MKRFLLILMLCATLTACGTPSMDPTTADTTDVTKESTTQHQAENPSSEPQNVESQPERTAITVYVPNENVDGFDTVVIEGEKLSFLEAMIKAGVLTEDVEINAFSWTEDTVTVDFNGAFSNLINTMGTSGEYVLMGSIVNTLIELNDVQYVRITVDGEILESGHMVYDFPMEFSS